MRRALDTKLTPALAFVSIVGILVACVLEVPASGHGSKFGAAKTPDRGHSAELHQPAPPDDNFIDTTSKSEVRRAYLAHYEKNMIRPAMSVGVDLEKCDPGQAVTDGILPIMEAWNFMRGLNGLNAVTLDTSGAIAPYTQAAAMVSARNGKLSHYPAVEGFACATDDAVRGARHSNLAQSISQTSAETALWYYMDYSNQSNPTNDQLGHRLFMMDPQLSLSSIGAVAGYTAISVRTGEPYPGLPAEAMHNPQAPSPEWMSWPSAGFFPKQLLTSVGETNSGMDLERWSFSVLNADLSTAKATIIDPTGHPVPLTTIHPGERGITFTPRAIADYSTLLMKFPTIERKPVGQENLVYKVKIEGVKNAPKSTYEYQVALFDPLTPLEKTAPQIRLMEQPLTGVGYKLVNPIRMQVSAWPVPKYQWQERDHAGTWRDIPGANQETYTPDGIWSWDRSKNTEYRLIAISSEGTATSEPVRVAVQGLKNMPSSAKVPVGSRVSFEAAPIMDPDGSLFDTTYEWQVKRAGIWQRIFDDGHFEDTDTNRLSISRVTLADQGLQFRLVVRSKIFKLSGYDVVVSWSDGNAKLTVY